MLFRSMSPNLIQSDGFQINFHQIASNIAGFCMFSSKNLRISSEVSGFMIGLVCSGFGRGKSPIDPKASGFVGGNPPPTIGVSVWAVFGSGLGGLVGYTGWVDSPTHNALYNHYSSGGVFQKQFFKLDVKRHKQD